MKWFSSLGRRASAPSMEPEPAFVESKHRSLALNTLRYRLHEGRSYSVLDLGRACPENLSFFSQFAPRIQFENLFQTLKSFDYLSPDESVPLESVFGYLMPYKRNTGFDIIFSWDLFNYLDDRECSFLMKHLTRFCRTGSIVFSMISTQPLMPETPGHYSIVDSETISYRVCSKIKRPCPRYQETDLLRFFQGFRVCNSFLLRNGFKEYLFIYGS